mmetsp:Transcript_25903/g.26316  ORF Transcript_25903/g.26316 Transcript_25903/m.26316 type:complete len:88 (+) Transcript_25903:190-453(+)|eukprot:CAMPEP_0171304616 /NCGR_PEP_ID=MMETSP0816-20121228/14359_1 /TAXON_ID=420281 /ORGANISM="Proboscia inermis, Strain CCAP1064/1" /LENGTH=87 /DNA_ID=CAMNT_0011784817 /DNA_START=170 /DNA_END=433 /DNA_ORIENTATION=+
MTSNDINGKYDESEQKVPSLKHPDTRVWPTFPTFLELPPLQVIQITLGKTALKMNGSAGPSGKYSAHVATAVRLRKPAIRRHGSCIH